MSEYSNVFTDFWKDGITESQNGSARKESLEAICFNPVCQVGTPRACCTGPCLGVLSICLRKQTAQSPCTICNCAQTPSQKISVFLCSERPCCISVCVHYLLTCHWAFLKKACFHLCTLLSGIYMHDEIALIYIRKITVLLAKSFNNQNSKILCFNGNHTTRDIKSWV